MTERDIAAEAKLIGEMLGAEPGDVMLLKVDPVDPDNQYWRLLTRGRLATAEWSFGHDWLFALLPAAQRYDALRTLCAELYQVIGVLAEAAGAFDTDAVTRALDNAAAGAEGRELPHATLLPFGVER